MVPAGRATWGGRGVPSPCGDLERGGSACAGRDPTRGRCGRHEHGTQLLCPWHARACGAELQREVLTSEAEARPHVQTALARSSPRAAGRPPHQRPTRLLARGSPLGPRGAEPSVHGGRGETACGVHPLPRRMSKDTQLRAPFDHPGTRCLPQHEPRFAAAAPLACHRPPPAAARGRRAEPRAWRR